MHTSQSSPKPPVAAVVDGTAPDLELPAPACLFTGALDPCSIVIFGAAGDLTARKLMPALYNLFLSRVWPQPCGVVGVARTPWSRQEFQSSMQAAVATQKNYDSQQWQEFVDGYHQILDG